MMTSQNGTSNEMCDIRKTIAETGREIDKNQIAKETGKFTIQMN